MNKMIRIYILGVLSIFIIPLTAYGQEPMNSIGFEEFMDSLLTSPAAERDTVTVIIPENERTDWYVYEALATHPDIIAKRKQYLAMKENAVQAGALEDPQLTAGVFISPIETRTGPQQARLGIRQMFPWFGTLDARRQLALTETYSAWYDYLEARAELALRSHTRYANLYRLHKDTAQLYRQAKVYRSMERIALSRYENGKGSLADVLNVQLLVAETEAAINKKGNDLNEARLAFILLVGQEAYSLERLIPDTLISISSTDAGAEAYRIQAARQAIEAGKQRQELARLSGNPMLGAGLDYVITGRRDDMNVPDNGRDAIMPMVTVSLPIFRKKYKSMARQAELNTEAAKAALEGTGRQFATERMEAITLVLKANEDIILLRKQLYLAEKAQNLMISSYSAGTESLQNVLDIQQKILGYRMALNESIAQFFIYEKTTDYLRGTDRAVLETIDNEEFTK